MSACQRNKASKKEKGPEMKNWGKGSKKGGKGLQWGTQNESVGDRWPLARHNRTQVLPGNQQLLDRLQPKEGVISHFSTCRDAGDGWCDWQGEKIKHVGADLEGKFQDCKYKKNSRLPGSFEQHCPCRGCSEERRERNWGSRYFYMKEPLEMIQDQRFVSVAVQVEEDLMAQVSVVQLEKKKFSKAAKRKWRKKLLEASRKE